ncbi:MAG: 5'-nucleotidase C-terminal domain-containing protein [Ignavibacteriae bacterium]|nr:5'-nucleotidase C-terminal domain-containing protein [Ignavibacteriota bacterium]
MKTLVFFLLFTSFVYAQSTQITLLHTGDSHSHLDAFGPKDANNKGTIGGIGKAATIIGTVKATEPNVMFLHAGDFSVGDLFFNKYFGVPELQILQQLGCDALTVGNHEFDLGSTTLYSVLQESFPNGGFPVLSANLNLSGFPQLGNFVTPYTIKTVSGVKVGIFGMTIPSPLGNPYPVVINDSIAEITYATVSALQGQGANVIIMLSHLGWAIDSSLAANIPGINIIVGGHDHYLFNQPKTVNNPAGFQTYVVQAGESYEYVGKLKFTYSATGVTFNSYDLIHADASVPQATEIQGVVDYLKQGIVSTYGDVYGTMIGTAKNDIGRTNNSHNVHYKDSPIGNLITDSYRRKTHTDIAITANGLITQKIYKGKINSADIFQTAAYGFDTTTGLGFNLLKMKIRGTELIKGLETGLSQLGISEDFFLQVSGMIFKYNPNNPVGNRVMISSIRINNQQFNPARKYTFTINEGLYGILQMMGIEVENVEPTGIPEFIALKDCIISLNNVDYVSEGRIREKTNNSSNDELEPDENTGTIKSYQLYNNYPNPFNPVTTIKFQIPKDANVTLKVFNSLGQEIETLKSEYMKTGVYQVNWNGSRYSSGVYYYVLRSGSYTETKRMVMIK